MSREGYSFSNDWFDYNIRLWREHFAHLNNQPNHILEIGAYEGASTTWLLDELATHPESTVTSIDTFGTVEHPYDHELLPIPANDLEARFRENVALSPNHARLQVVRGFSRHVLRLLAPGHDEHFNFIYVDASHRARDVLDDAVMSWGMLRNDGYLVFDDYRWHKYEADYDNPKLAIDSFLGCYATELTVLHRNYQVIVRKHGRTAEAVRNPGEFIREIDNPIT